MNNFETNEGDMERLPGGTNAAKKSKVPSIMTAPTKTASEDRDPGMATTTVKKKPGRPRKKSFEELAMEQSSATSMSSTTVSGNQSQTKTGLEIPSTSSVESSAGNKRRGASPEVLAKARAVAKQKREQQKGIAALQVEPELVLPTASGWPFPSSTRYNSDGTEKRREEEVQGSCT